MAENMTTRTNWPEYPIEASNSHRRQPPASNNHQQHQASHISIYIIYNVYYT